MARDIPLPGQRRKLFNEKKRARRRESEGDRRRPARRFSFPPRRRREIGVTTDGLISVPRRIDLNTICCLRDFAARRRQKSDRVRKDGGKKGREKMVERLQDTGDRQKPAQAKQCRKYILR